MASPLAPILPRLALLIPRLSTEHDGEVVATVRAIGRTLKGASLDFHDLAMAVATEPEPEPGPYRPTYTRPRQGKACEMPPLWEHLGQQGRLAWLDSVLTSDWPSEFEAKLAAGIRVVVYTQPHKIQTPKQRFSLNRLLVRAFIMGERP
jgi:hypothetical protein